jgi:hypothetical protein
LVCYGGNKFMHSDRPKKYFDRLVLKDFWWWMFDGGLDSTKN